MKPVAAPGWGGQAVLIHEAQGHPLPSVKPVSAPGREDWAVLTHRVCVVSAVREPGVTLWPHLT